MGSFAPAFDERESFLFINVYAIATTANLNESNNFHENKLSHLSTMKAAVINENLKKLLSEQQCTKLQIL